MIENTFVFLPRVNLTTERNIWRQGIHNWAEFLNTSEINGIGQSSKLFYDKMILEARKALFNEDMNFFAQTFPRSEHWRLYDYFKDDAVFLDIETCVYNRITVVGLYDNYEVKHFIRGANLDKEALRNELSKYKLIVTFNGSSFDLPMIKKHFKETLPDVPHMDLRHVCAKIGLTGGLKLIEQELEIERPEHLFGVQGGEAVLLWEKFRATEDYKYLQQLLDYNAEDVINLKPLADYAFRECCKFFAKAMRPFEDLDFHK